MILDEILSIVSTKSDNMSGDAIKIKYPTLQKIKNSLKGKKHITIVMVDITDLYAIENKYGRKVAHKITDSFQRLLYQKAQMYFFPAEILSLQNFSEDMFIIYISQESPFDQYELKLRSRDLRESLTVKMEKDSHIYKDALHINIGFSTLSPKPKDIEKNIFNAIKQSFQSATDDINLQEEKLTAELTKIIEEKDFNILYQPLVSLRSAQIFGYEALSRGPKESYFFSPDHLFPFAEKAGILLQLERVTRELAIINFQGTGSNQKLFINLSPKIINDPTFARGETIRLIQKLKLLPQNIVFEITERNSIKDFDSFKKIIMHYRNQGFLIAIDDAGAGYSSLQSIAELKPDFIKIDMSLVKNIDKDTVKKALLETFVTFAHKINSQIIAEGIETAAELKTLLNMGVTFGQGYFLARPGNPLPLLETQASQVFCKYYRTSRTTVDSDSIQIGNIADMVKRFPKETPTKEVVSYFSANEHARAVVILENTQPIGLIMRDKLYQQISTQYGVALYWEKPASLVMDANPLIVDAQHSLMIVSDLANNRSHQKLYDDIVVTKNHLFLGTLSVQKLLSTLHKEA